jgi:hypothetical protein
LRFFDAVEYEDRETTPDKLNAWLVDRQVKLQQPGHLLVAALKRWTCVAYMEEDPNFEKVRKIAHRCIIAQ